MSLMESCIRWIFGRIYLMEREYLWSDRCMFEGEWKKRKASGKGKFLWTSGATYVAEFKSRGWRGLGHL